MASLFTSKYPLSHGVIFSDYDEEELKKYGLESYVSAIDPVFITLAESLKSHGYTTFGISTNPFCAAATGMDQGFDTFIDISGGWEEGGFTVSADQVHQAVIKLTEDLVRKQPFFLWIHYIDPHSPYLAREPWINNYSDDLALARRLAEVKFNDVVDFPYLTPDSRELKSMVDLYDSEINYTDYYIEKLFREVIPEADSLVIITADHGEEFLDHGEICHGHSLFDETVKIPLIMAKTGKMGEGSVVSEVVSINDIYPTILDYLFVPVPSDLAGRSLVPYFKCASVSMSQPVFSEIGGPNRANLQSVRLNDWKLIRGQYGQYGTKGNPEVDLFNLRLDPAEHRNLVDNQPEMKAKLEMCLNNWEEIVPKHDPSVKSEVLTPERKRALKSLGYVN